MDDTFITIRVRRVDLDDLDQLIAHELRHDPEAKLPRSVGFKRAVAAWAKILDVALAPREPDSK